MLATQDDCSPSPNDLRRERLLKRRRAIDLEEIAFSRDAADFAASDAWDEDGSVSAIDWMRFHCHMNSGAAANSITVGEMLERLPESHQAVVDGEIGFAHLATMARTAEALQERFDEKVLVEKGALPSGLIQDHRATCLRLWNRPDPSQLRVSSDRRRALQAGGVRARTASADCA